MSKEDEDPLCDRGDLDLGAKTVEDWTFLHFVINSDRR